MKRTIAVIAFLAGITILTTQGISWARGGMNHGGYGAGAGQAYAPVSDLTPEQQKSINDIFNSHMANTTQMRLEQRADMARLEALTADPRASDKEIKALTQRIADRHAEMLQQRVEVDRKASKVAGHPVSFNAMRHGRNGKHGMGRGMMNNGRMMNQGNGYGPHHNGEFPNMPAPQNDGL